MSRSVSPGSFRSSEGGASRRQPFFVIDLVRRFGIKAVLAIAVADPRELEALPREWTRDQLAALRNWLPADALSARTALSPLVDRLRWRESLQGWFCYVAAAVSGLVFTRWGAIAILEPWRRGKAWSESLGLLVKIALASVAGWILFNLLTN